MKRNISQSKSDNLGFTKHEEHHMKIDRRLLNVFRRFVGETLAYDYVINKILKENIDKKRIRIICNVPFVITQQKENFLKRFPELIEVFIPNVKGLDIHTVKEVSEYLGRRVNNASEKYIVVKGIHKIKLYSRTTSGFGHIFYSDIKDDSVPDEFDKDYLLNILENKDTKMEDEKSKIFGIEKEEADKIYDEIIKFRGGDDRGLTVPDYLLMDFEIIRKINVDVETTLGYVVDDRGRKTNRGHGKYKTKKTTISTPLAKLHSVIPIEVKTIPIKDGSFTQGQKEFLKEVSKESHSIMKPRIIHIPFDDFYKKGLTISEYEPSKSR